MRENTLYIYIDIVKCSDDVTLATEKRASRLVHVSRVAEATPKPRRSLNKRHKV